MFVAAGGDGSAASPVLRPTGVGWVPAGSGADASLKARCSIKEHGDELASTSIAQIPSAALCESETELCLTVPEVPSHRRKGRLGKAECSELFLVSSERLCRVVEVV